jgi:hypothetical protein
VRNASKDLTCRRRAACDVWTFQLLGFEVFQVRLQKKATSTVSIKIDFNDKSLFVFEIKNCWKFFYTLLNER